MKINKEYMDVMRTGCKIERSLYRKQNNSAWILFIVGLLFFLLLGTALSFATELPSDERIADAIYKAENSKAHPYGIMVKYKHTTPRQACINTIRHAKRDWDGKGDFIVFLGNRYAPIGVKNDPTGLNKNWIKNVRYFLDKQDKRAYK